MLHAASSMLLMVACACHWIEVLGVKILTHACATWAICYLLKSKNARFSLQHKLHIYNYASIGYIAASCTTMNHNIYTMLVLSMVSLYAVYIYRLHEYILYFN